VRGVNRLEANSCFSSVTVGLRLFRFLWELSAGSLVVCGDHELKRRKADAMEKRVCIG